MRLAIVLIALLSFPVFAQDEKLKEACEQGGGCLVIPRAVIAAKMREAFMQGFIEGATSVQCVKPKT